MGPAASVSNAEIARFDALAAQWWDPKGPMRPLHQMNPLRVGWIDERIRTRFGAPARVLDVGCGAGLAAEALARLGHLVLGLDAAPATIRAAEAHARGQSLTLAYRAGAAEELAAEGLRFPVITALEVIEHVTDKPAFIRLLAGLLEPGGLLFLSTLNRTPKSFLMAKFGAEYVLRLLPMGTHDWGSFPTPGELGGSLRAAGLEVADIAGMTFEPLRRRWKISRDLGVNYIVMAGG